ncbi:hypothetical protein Sjap_005297 [Stephania japonica]|uniref:Uncharacterized protein n=1 Tax=Stephania japonica TaxID=461633 RepID=A0AAP0K588_9MAGN
MRVSVVPSPDRSTMRSKVFWTRRRDDAVSIPAHNATHGVLGRGFRGPRHEDTATTNKAFADEIGILFMETSAKSATNVEQAFMAMVAEFKY